MNLINNIGESYSLAVVKIIDKNGKIKSVMSSGGGGSAAWGTITGTLSSQLDLQSALNAKQDLLVSATNIKTINGSSILGSGDLTVSGSGATWGSITGTLSSQTDLQSALNAKYDASNPSGYIDSSALTPYLTSVTAAATYYPLTNPSGYISGITSGDVTTALGYTPYSNTNPNNYIDASALTPYLTSALAASTYVPLTRTITINGVAQDLSADRSWTVSGGGSSPGTLILLSTDESEDTGANTTSNVKTYTVASNTYSYIMAECEVGFVGGANSTCQMDFTLDIGGVVSRTGSIRQPATGSGDYQNTLGNIKISTALTAGGTVSISVNEVSNGATWYVYSLRVYGIV